MLKSLFGLSKHSRAFRRMMILELRPKQVAHIRNFSETRSAMEQQQATKFEAAKRFIKNAHIEESAEANKVLKVMRKAGALSVLVVFASVGYAVFLENFSKPNAALVEEMEGEEEYMPQLSQDIRYKQKGKV
ncbi:uncharacterized protein LODBEIA_P29030 [Lodderomyces beijingensis]|uniref:Uncharacterized protein n=1 Tax=Lodderomyces beijingensis TaxID=1775926 RepID=A0ABP0ZKJ7_9ASCO